jgi:hypothetical protein
MFAGVRRCSLSQKRKLESTGVSVIACPRNFTQTERYSQWKIEEPIVLTWDAVSFGYRLKVAVSGRLVGCISAPLVRIQAVEIDGLAVIVTASKVILKFGSKLSNIGS